ncbi:MAG: STAS domain-containing protein [Actinomycetota bacterium]|nr:STAS domain-containing protein [Actinomycetota bacterium]
MTTSELQVAVRKLGTTAVIDLIGDVNASADGALSEAYAQATGDAVRAIALNFEAVQYINSTGIALIVGLLAQARTNRIEMKAFGLSDHYREIFEITRLADFMTIADNEHSALGTSLRAPEGSTDA